MWTISITTKNVALDAQHFVLEMLQASCHVTNANKHTCTPRKEGQMAVSSDSDIASFSTHFQNFVSDSLTHKTQATLKQYIHVRQVATRS